MMAKAKSNGCLLGLVRSKEQQSAMSATVPPPPDPPFSHIGIMSRFLADGILFQHDLHGVDPIIDVHRRYFTNFEYEHRPLARTVDPDRNSAFGLWLDRGVHRRTEETGQGEAGEEGGTDIAGIWKLVFERQKPTAGGNEGDYKVKEIFFLRQLHREEANHRLRDPSSFARGVDPSRFPAVDERHDAPSEKVAAARRAAELYSKAWQSSDTSAAREALDPKVRILDLMDGGEQVGVDKFVHKLEAVSKGWRVQNSDVDIGVAPDGTAAIVHWVSTGHLEDGSEEGPFTMFGLNFIQVDVNSGKIVQTAGFRSLAPEERKSLLRADAFIHAPIPQEEQ
jgi:hypothetical protein